MVHHGIKGTITDEETGEPINNAALRIAGRDVPFYTDRAGNFWRILPPGTYTLQV